MRTCSTRSSSLASTSMRMPSRSTTSPGFGHTAQPLADQAADRGGFDIFLAAERVEQIADAVEVEIAGDDEAALAVFDRRRCPARARRGSRR